MGCSPFTLIDNQIKYFAQVYGFYKFMFTHTSHKRIIQLLKHTYVTLREIIANNQENNSLKPHFNIRCSLLGGSQFSTCKLVLQMCQGVPFINFSWFSEKDIILSLRHRIANSSLEHSWRFLENAGHGEKMEISRNVMLQNSLSEAVILSRGNNICS